jgi:uncharacterized membrane protein YtjA (UPF0391 family)
MLIWSLSFLVIGIVAATSGFCGTGSGAPALAPICFLFFLAAFGASPIWHLAKARRSAAPH